MTTPPPGPLLVNERVMQAYLRRMERPPEPVAIRKAFARARRTPKG